MMNRLLPLALLCALAIGLSACQKPAQSLQPIEPTRSTASAVDGMLLLDYPGPKGQIHYGDGEVAFFSDTVEMTATALKPESQRKILAIYTQDMAKTDWDKPHGHWIDARSAFFVAGSRKTGSMGPTLASFASRADADGFARQNGGKVFTFQQLTPDMVQLDGGVVHDEKM
jgi:copper chaperone NosL